MEAVIGQEKLVKILDGYTLQTVPRTMLFLGPTGCGKDWIATRFANRLELDVVKIQPTVTTDLLIDYCQYPLARMYLIDLKDFDERQQNKILKFIEEPSANMYIILKAESEIGILPTILNRCVKYTFEDYTPDQLKEFAWAVKCSDARLYDICKTPGQLNNLPEDNLDNVFSLCETIIKAIPTANYANTISLVTYINMKDDAKKIDFDLFFEVMLRVSFDEYIKNNAELAYKIYSHTARQRALAFGKSIAKESFLLNYFDALWRLAH